MFTPVVFKSLRKDSLHNWHYRYRAEYHPLLVHVQESESAPVSGCQRSLCFPALFMIKLPWFWTEGEGLTVAAVAATFFTKRVIMYHV